MEGEELGARGGPGAAGGQGAAPRNNWNTSEQGHSLPQLKLLLLGKHGAGKSATGNTILGTPVFKSKLTGKQMITTVCQRESGIVKGTEVVVIDTPDFFCSKLSAEDKSLQLKRCVELSAPSLHALLLIIPIGHFKKEDEEAMEGITSRFGPESRKHSIIVFTREDDLGKDSLEDYIEENESLKALVQECGLRYCAFNNKASQEDTQVSKLICKIKDLVQENKGPYCLPLKKDSGLQDTYRRIVRRDNSHGSEEMQLQSTSSESASELKVMLVGKQGAGKSTLGNRLLGKRVFDTGFSKTPVTTAFKSESRDWERRKILIIDSPDISSPNEFQSELRAHTFGDPHVFLMVIPKNSFSEEDETVLESIRKSFGNNFVEHLFIVLTREEDSCQPTKMLQTRNSLDSLDNLTMKCKHQPSFFNYKAVGKDEQLQVDQLLQNLVSLTQQNENKSCVMIKENTLSIVLVGRSGAGKSATGNTILGNDDFPSQLSAQSVTKTCERRKKDLWGQDVVVVDTPSFLVIPSDSEGPSQVEEEIKHCLHLCEGNKILFVLVLQLGRFTQMEQNVLVQLETNFGKKVKKYTIVLFTRKEDLEDDDINDYIKGIDCKALEKTVKECGWHVCAFNNRESGEAREKQVKSLLEKANDLIKKRGGQGYPCTCDDVSLRTKHDQKKPKAQNQDLSTMILSQGQKCCTGFKSVFQKDAKKV